jgi:branched-chain amino acid transport system substrate-binding protein
VAHPSIAVDTTDFRAALDGLPRLRRYQRSGPLLRQMRLQGLDQLFACGDGCWDVKGFIEPAQGAWSKGDGVLILSAAPAIGVVPGSADFAERYTRRYGPIANDAANSYDLARILMRRSRPPPRPTR